ncbi:hypothetical protein TNCV_668791 [Trichonephila clavipes]|nr:hypothetical protein TNCV_668791 [Trichonephila clavipes]
MRYYRALRLTSFVSCLETFRSIFAVTLPLVRSDLWDAQLPIPNDLRYPRLETHLGIGQPKEGRPASIPSQSSFLECGTTPNGGIDGWASSAVQAMGTVIPNVFHLGAFELFEKTQGPLVKVLPVPG